MNTIALLIIALILFAYAWAEMQTEGSFAPMSEDEKEDLMKTLSVFTEVFKKKNA